MTRCGKICAKHPDLEGKRYHGGGCVGCQRDHRRARYLRTTRQTQEAQPARDVIRDEIEEQVMATRRVNALEILREERRRQLLRDEIPAMATRRWW